MARSASSVVRGPTAGEGYWNQRAKSRRTFAGEWTYTGDKFFRDADGYYHYCGRTDDMFKVSGMWVSPFEVEAALASHEAVLEAAVIGKEDADGLIKPKAFIVLRDGYAGSEHLIENAARAREGIAPARGSIRAGSICGPTCRAPRPGRFSGSSCGNWKPGQLGPPAPRLVPLIPKAAIELGPRLRGDERTVTSRRTDFLYDSNSRCTSRRASTPATRRR